MITSAGTLPKATSSAVDQAEHGAEASPARNTTTIGMPGWSTKSVPVRYAVRPSMEPTDRSTLRVMITTAWPTASSSRIEGVSSRSRQPLR